MIVENNKYIEEFICSIKSKYDNLVIKYDYDEEEDLYDIWHNSQNLQYKDTDFLCFAGKLIKEILFKNDIYNFCFGYDYYKAKDLENGINRYTLEKLEPGKIEYEYIKIDDLPDFNNNINTNADLYTEMNVIKVYYDYVELKPQRKHFSNILFLESDSDFSDNTIFTYDELKEAS